MAANAPNAPTITKEDSTRTLTTVDLNFIADVDDGGSPITGYILYRDEGVSGSPYAVVYNGTARPEIIMFTSENLTTSLTYTYKLYSMNKIFESSGFASLTV